MIEVKSEVVAAQYELLARGPRRKTLSEIIHRLMVERSGLLQDPRTIFAEMDAGMLLKSPSASLSVNSWTSYVHVLNVCVLDCRGWALDKQRFTCNDVFAVVTYTWGDHCD